MTKRKNFLIVLLGFICTVFILSPISLAEEMEPYLIFGNDDRVPVYDTYSSPYKEVVYLEIQTDTNAYRGSGVLIAPNKVSTAAHNIINTNRGTIANKIIVYPGRVENSQPFGYALGVNYHYLTGFTADGFVTSYYTDSQQQNDLAVITLDRSFQVGYLGVTTSMSQGEQVRAVGYPGDKAIIMHYSYGPIESFNRNLIMNKIDSMGGLSGAPLLNSKNQIVGINVGGASAPEVNGQRNYTVPSEYPYLNFARKIDGTALELIDVAVNNKSATNNVTALIPTYRLYNDRVKRHILTASESERNYLVQAGWKNEGITWYTNTKGKPVYRLYNNSLQKHLYTSDVNEVNVLSRRGWRNEGMAWYSDGLVTIYRLYNEGVKSHLFTKDINERNALIQQGWREEPTNWTVMR